MDFKKITGLIVSAERSGLSKTENAKRSAVIVHELLDAVGWDAKVIPVEGAWEGQREQSYIVVPNDDVAMNPLEYRTLLYKVLAIASEAAQDAVMSVHNGTSFLIELPACPPTVNREQRMDYLYGVLTYDKGNTLLSDALRITEIDEESAMLFGEYTRLDDKYYIMLPA